MKNLYSLIFVILIFQIKATAQDTIYNMTDADFEHLFDGVNDLENLSTNYLKNKTVDFLPLEKYNGVLTDSNYVQEPQLRALYAQFSQMQVSQTNKALGDYENMDSILKKLGDKKDTTYFMGFASKYSFIRNEYFSDGTVELNNKRISFDQSANTIQDITDEGLTFAIGAVGVNQASQNQVFYFDKNLFFADAHFENTDLAVDFNDGLGFRMIQWNQYIKVNYSTAGEKNIIFRMQHDNQSILSYTKLEVIPSEQNNTIDANFDFTQRFTASLKYSSSGSYASGTVTVAHGESTNKKLDKPVLIIEGFDESDYIDPSILWLFPTNLVTKKDYRYFLLKKLIETPDFKSNLEINGYDIVHLNFDNTGDFMQNQAYLVQRVISWLRSHPDRTDEIVVIGLSSGGIIGRYALADWEKRLSYDHDVRLLATFDSGHDGNNVPIGAQFMIDDLNDKKISGVNLRFLMPSLVDIKRMLGSPSSRQMLSHYVYPNESLNQSFFNELNSLGYPKKCRNIAIASGSGTGIKPGIGDNDFIINTDKWKSSIVLPLGTSLLSFALTGVTPIVSYTVQIKTMASSGASTNVYEGNYFFWWGPLILASRKDVNYTGRSAYASAPGGRFFDENVGGFPQLNNVGFVPTASALDIMNHSNPNPNRIPQSSSANMCDTPFDNWYAPSQNEMHVAWNSGNTAFLWNEINNPEMPCEQKMCRDVRISGNSTLCSTGTFYLSNLPVGASVSWSRSANLSYVSGQNSTAYRVSPSSSGSGWVEAKVTLDGCGKAVIRKNISIGKPSLANFYPRGPISLSTYQYGYYTAPIAQNSTSQRMKIVKDGGTVATGSSTSIGYSFLNPGTYRVIAEASNNCGTISSGLTVTVSGSGGGGCQYVLELSSSNPSSNVFQYRLIAPPVLCLMSEEQESTQGAFSQNSLTILDFKGNVVFAQKLDNDFFEIDLSNKETGMYIVRVNWKGQQLSDRIIKN